MCYDKLSCVQLNSLLHLTNDSAQSCCGLRIEQQVSVLNCHQHRTQPSAARLCFPSALQVVRHMSGLGIGRSTSFEHVLKPRSAIVAALQAALQCGGP